MLLASGLCLGLSVQAGSMVGGIQVTKPEKPTLPARSSQDPQQTIEAERLATLLLRARAGEAESQYQVATVFMQYDILSKNADRVAEWFLKAAKQGHTAAATWILASVVDPRDLFLSKELFTEMRVFANGYIMALQRNPKLG